MTVRDILQLRLHNEQLSQQQFKTPQEVVGWFGAVQSQDYGGAKWAVGQRLPGFTDVDLEKAFANGEILRTHVMRPTWHFVTPKDIKWMLKLTAPRIKIMLQYYNKQLKLNDEIFTKAENICKKILAGGNALTREEISVYFEKAKLPSKGQALGHLVMWPELNGVICSGPRKGKQFTYMLVDERAPNAISLSRDEALAELAKRYFQSHGPATIKDFRWWSGLTIANAKKGVELNKHALQSLESEGLTYYYIAIHQKPAAFNEAYVLSNYDEYTIAYKNRDIFYDPTNQTFFDTRENVIFNNMIVLEGRLFGMWRRTLTAKTITVEVRYFSKLMRSEQRQIEAAFQKYASFFGRSMALL